MTHSYLFVLGRTPDLAFAELQRFYPHCSRISDEIAQISSQDTVDPQEAIQKLGGVIKIAEAMGVIPILSPSALLPYFSDTLQSVEFGVSTYGSSLPKSFLGELKKILDGRGVHARYLAPHHGNVLSSVVVQKKDVREFIVVKVDEGYAIGITRAVQPFEAWGDRDYGRPYADAKSGMLPPKVARMVVNIAGSAKTLLDPFCGMGTILSEGYACGWTVNGSDVLPEVAQKAKANLEWLVAKNLPGAGTVGQIFTCDAVHISNVVPHNSIDAIVTEPYMGSTQIANEQRPDIGKIKNTIKGLEKLYIGCLRDWSHVLVNQGKVVIALPEYVVAGRTYFVKKVIDMCEILGYTIESGPIAYHRPKAVVRRNFFVLRKTT